MKPTRQLFLCDSTFIDAFTNEEVAATYSDMCELGIAHPPYPDFDVIIPAHYIMSLKSTREWTPHEIAAFNQWKLKYCFTDSQPVNIQMDQLNGNWYSLDPDHPDYKGELANMRDTGISVLKFLVVALATRNVIKEIKPNKLAKLGIGKSPYAASTTLRIGAITEFVVEGKGTHAAPRPHLRRGHIRHQHHGPNNEHVKSIWIAAVFVNVDQEFIDRRTAYNLRASPQPSNKSQ